MPTDTPIITVSAPGNVMLMGEHAVLFGHRAIVCAVSQRLTVTLTPRDDEGIWVRSTLATYETTRQQLQNNTANIPPDLSFVFASIRAQLPDRGFELEIQSAFSHTVGLGSSAAVVAACLYALTDYRYGNVSLDDVFARGLSVIHAVQKRGSGSDLAASVYGGIISYTVEPRKIKPLLNTETLTADHYPKLDLLYCGYKTPTPEVLSRIARESQAFPDIYQQLYQQMHHVSLAAETAIRAHDWAQLGKLMNIYHGLMDALGVSDAALSRLVYQSRQHAGVLGCKISGSGLGDCVIALSQPDSPTPLQNNEAHIDARITPQGVIKTSPTAPAL